MAKPDLILIALDDSSILMLMERALRGKYETAIAKDTQALGRLLQESNPALLLLGERFDGHEGVKAAKELIDRFPALPILIYAEKANPELIKDILWLGLSGYISPPRRAEEIVEAVDNSLRKAQRVGDWLRREVKRTTSSLKRRAEISDAERSRLELVFNNIHDSVMILDPKKNILLLNPAMCRAFDLNVKTAIGKPVLDVLKHPDLIALLSRTGAVNNDPLQFHEVNFPDGRVGNAQLTAIYEVGYAITMQDITYLKETDRIRSEFVSTVSHDLRSPLTSVIGYSELLERAGPLNKEQHDFLNRLRDGVQHITSLVNGLLDLGSVEAGFDTQREFVQLEGVLRYTLDMLHGQIKSKRLKVHTEISQPLPALRADPIRLRQVLDNIVGNAIKYSHTGGEIRISIRCEGDQMILQVTDQGPGIPPTDQQHIFDKFYRGSNVPLETEGSGLGLAIVKTIVEHHQGRIWVESALGKGSSFFIVLPLLSELAKLGKK
jgi:PAS domain S-box-containing protein